MLTLCMLVVTYVYALTYNSLGRMDWGQALFLKLTSEHKIPIENIRKMSVQERSHITDDVHIDLAGLRVDTLKITADSIPVFIYRQQNQIKNAPVVVYYHGGAFILPWSKAAVTYAARFARLFNAVVVCVDYRVAPEHPFPIPNLDCYETLLWTLNHIHAWDGNPNQIILAGESAGATLAATVANKAHLAGLKQIRYQILDCPVGYVPFQSEAFQKFKFNYFLEEPVMKYGLESYLPNKADYTNPQAMPYHLDSILGLPPAFVVTCEFDPLKDAGRDYAQKLKDANIPIQYKEMKGMLHCMPGPFNEKDRNALYQEIADDFAKTNLNH